MVNLSILIADDDKSIRTLLQRFIRISVGKLGKQVHVEIFEAQDGDEAVVIATEKQPDILFLDIIMPNLSGDEVLKRMRLVPELELMTAVIVSSSRVPETIHALSKLNIAQYLLKPLVIEQFEQRTKGIFNSIIQKKSTFKKNIEIKQAKPRPDGTNVSRVLMIDADVDFLRSMLPALQKHATILATPDSSEGLQIVRYQTPQAVVIASGSRPLDELAFAKLLHEQITQNLPALYLSTANLSAVSVNSFFDAVLLKSSDPAVFAEEFLTKVIGKRDVHGALIQMLVPALLSQFFSNFGAMLKTNTRRMVRKTPLSSDTQIPKETQIIAEYSAPADDIFFAVIVTGARKDMSQLLDLISDEPFTSLSKSVPVMQTLFTPTLTAVQRIFHDKGIHPRLTRFDVTTIPYAEAHYNFDMFGLFTLEGGIRFMAGIVLETDAE